MDNIILGSGRLTLDDLVAISRLKARVSLSEQACTRITAARRIIDEWVRREKTIYGITTGFGALSEVAISKKQTAQLQKNILMSHACGVGDLLDEETTRAVMALRAMDMALGYSGIRMETVKLLVELLNREIHPVIPEKGSVGASGDLIPLAHLGLVLIGLGEVCLNGRRMPAQSALEECHLKPVRLASAEGLALVNGTQAMTAIGALAVYDACKLSQLADIAAAMSLEVLMGSRTEFDARIHRLRPHPGQGKSADNLLRITQNSEIISSHKDCKRVQDAYTLRCSPQVHGASKDAVFYALNVIETEMNSATNNPLILAEDETFLLGGNFHGQPVALAMDFLCMAVAELANISERRIERLVNPKLSGLPAFLIKNGGLNSGLMIAQYTAAALVSENKVLSHPACVDSIPTSANKEDHVSMGTLSSRKCREIVQNTETVIAIELLCAAQAMDLFTNLKAGEGTRRAYQVIREAVPHLENDRILCNDIERIKVLIRERVILDAVSQAVGKLE